MMRATSGFIALVVTGALLVACAAPTVPTPAPIVERVVRTGKVVAIPDEPGGKRPPLRLQNSEIYTVQKGDTLYSIAFARGLDYRELAELNNLADPSLIQIGQQLQIPLVAAAPVESKLPAGGGVKTQPRVTKIPWSKTALREAEQLQQDVPSAKKVVAPPTPVAVVAPTAAASMPPPALAGVMEESEGALEWTMPTKGTLIARFSDSANKGIDIAGKLGQPVLASAAGKVVYSGSGLRGYGKLVIIKHNNEYLSAYAHNDQILVKEGQSVSRGQKIAEMGNSDSDRVKLHFEIRRFGKPVDPALYLPLTK